MATCMTSVVERLLAAGPKATGCNVEVVLLSTGQRRNGIVSMCYPADRIVAINFGHMTANLEVSVHRCL